MQNGPDNYMDEQIELGDPIQTIEFSTKASEDEEEYAENGILSWAHINLSEEDLEALIDGEEVVLEHRNAILILSDSLISPEYYTLTSADEHGFSRRELILSIGQLYYDIYAKTPEKTRDHDLDELDLVSLLVYKNREGQIYIKPEIDS